MEGLGGFSVVAVCGMEARHKIIEIRTLQGVRLQREMLIRAEVVYPERFCPGLLAGGLAVEEEDIGLDALGIENPGGQAYQSMDIAFVQQLTAHGFSSTA